MKKIALYGLASVLALSFAACDNYEEPNPMPQTNPQESILKTEDVKIETLITEGVVYDLMELNGSATDIAIAKISTTKLPDAYEFATDIYIASINNPDRLIPVEASYVVKSEEEEGVYTVYVTPDNLQSAFYSGISKGPNEKYLWVNMKLKTVLGNQVAYVGGTSAQYYNVGEMFVKPFPSELVIEDAYYILGTCNDWSVANAIKFNHSDKSPYDDPVFTIKVDITPDQAAGGWWWKIVPQSTYANGDWINGNGAQYGVQENGSEEASGSLVGMTVNAAGDVTFEPGAGCFKQAGQWLITINLEDGTYEFSSAVDYLYTPGDANGWSQTASQLLYTENYSDYMGYAVLSPNGFKFSSAPDWDHVNYGDGGAEGVLSTDGGAGNLSVPAFGLYWCNVNTASLNYKVEAITTYGIIGDATPGGWDASTALTTTDQLIWTGTVHLGVGEYKFRANDSWDYNLGGDPQNLTPGGNNIVCKEEGDYNVTLNLGTLPYSCTVVKK